MENEADALQTYVCCNGTHHETSWESFCPKYKDSAFFKINFEVIGLTDVPCWDSKYVLGEDNVLSNDIEKVEKFEDIPLPVHKSLLNHQSAEKYLIRSSL